MDPYLLLAVAEGCGQGLITALLDPHADPEAVLADPPDDLPAAARRRLCARDLPERAAAWLAAARSCGYAVLTPQSDAYPDRLRQAPLRPLVLFTRGNRDLLRSTTRSVTVVGSRTPTPYGRAAARDFGETLCRAGAALWSGLAIGIDAEAHEASLRCGTPTVAVLAGGLDRIYPAHHGPLCERIVRQGGLCLSELPPGARPQRGHFPRRNRILAHGTDAVLVVEAGLASGSLHTARFAAEAGVPVFAVPGPYTSSRSRGCHRLIEDGAMLASDPADLLRHLGVSVARRADGDPRAAMALEVSADEAAILAVLECGPRPQDLVRRETGLADERFLVAVLNLHQKRLAVQLPGDLLARGPGGGA